MKQYPVSTLPDVAMALVLAFLLVALATMPAEAQSRYGRAPGDATIGQGERPNALEDVGFDQKLGDTLPLDVAFRDQSGDRVTLAQVAEGKALVVVPVYYECPMLCNLVLSGVATSLDMLAFDAGDEYEVAFVSIDPDETPEAASQAEERFLRQYERPEAADGLHFLTGDEEAIHRVTDAIGFRYAYDAARDEWAHTAGITLVTPEGTIARYFFGIEYPPRDLRLALVETSDGSIGNAIDEVFLYCFRYDPTTGQYSAVVINILRIAGILTLLAIGAYFLAAWLLRRRRGGSIEPSMDAPSMGEA